MSEAKFTRGPWQMSGSRGPSPEYRGHGVGPDGGDYVVVVPYNDKDHAECIANARLIAAAPDMHAALQTVIACPQAAVALARVGTGKFIGIDQWGGEQWVSNALDDIRAAIAKAEGRQP